MGELRIPYLVPSGIEVCHLSCTRFMGPEAIRILPEKVVIIGLVNNEGNLRGSRWTLLFKARHLDIGIVS